MCYKQLNIRVPEQELKILTDYAAKTQRTKTDIIREFIRSLPSASMSLVLPQDRHSL